MTQRIRSIPVLCIGRLLAHDVFIVDVNMMSSASFD